MKLLKYSITLIGIILICSGCSNDKNYYKHLSHCKSYSNTEISIDWIPLLPIIPRDIFLSQKQIIKLKNNDCMLKDRHRSIVQNASDVIEYYLPENYAKDFGKLVLDFDKYPAERLKLKKDFCKKYSIYCDSYPTLDNIYSDMNSFYKVSATKKYKMISKEDRNNDIQECKNIMKKLRNLSIVQADFWQKHIYYQHELISGIKASSNTSSLGNKEYDYALNKNTDFEWIVEYRTNYSICKAYAYPDGTGTYQYRPAILDPNKKWNIWLGSKLFN